MNLFEEEKIEWKQEKRPTLPAGTVIDYEIGFLFNFASGKSTRFDLEPLLVYKKEKLTEFKRISLQAERGLAYLQPLDDSTYKSFLEFSDNQLLLWMTKTGNRFIRNHSGSWAHVSAKELINLRKHYVDLLSNLWPALSESPNVYLLRSGRFVESNLKSLKLGKEPAKLSFNVDTDGKLIFVKMIVHLDGQEARLNMWGGFILENEGTIYLPPNTEALAIIDQFKNGPLSYPLSIKKEVLKIVMPWMERYTVTISEKLNIENVYPEPQPRVFLTELNESNLMIRPQFSYDDVVLDYGDEDTTLDESQGKLKIINRNKAEELKLYEYLRTLHPSFVKQRNNQYYYLPFADVMKAGWFITMMRKVQDLGYAVRGLQELKKFRYNTNIPRFDIQASVNTDWFDLKVTIHWGDQNVSLKEIRKAILNQQDTIMLEDGTLGHIPDEWISQYSLLLRTSTEENGTLKVSKLHYTLLDDILEKVDGATVQQDIAQRKEKLLQYDSIQKTELSSEIKATLRPYQLSGFHWMQAMN